MQVGSASKGEGGALALTGRKRKASQKKLAQASDDEDESEEVRRLGLLAKGASVSKLFGSPLSSVRRFLEDL